MRVHHFISADYGLDSLRDRRLKISILEELNDPFELFAIEVSDQRIRQALKSTRRKLSESRGIHCFCKGWSNPVLWSHYANKHRGLCFSFDVPDQYLVPIRYVSGRQKFSFERLLDCPIDDKEVFSAFCMKYVHWRYEDEVRTFTPLENEDSKGRFFSAFSEVLRLRAVIVGARSEISRADIFGALGTLNKEVEVFKARLAFRSFKVVRNKDQSLWK